MEWQTGDIGPFWYTIDPDTWQEYDGGPAIQLTVTRGEWTVLDELFPAGTPIVTIKQRLTNWAAAEVAKWAQQIEEFRCEID